MKRSRKSLTVTLLAGMSFAAVTSVSLAWFSGLPTIFLGADNNNANNAFVQPQDDAEAGGGRDQTLQFGDAIFGGWDRDVIAGRLGTDHLFGGTGSDILIGGTEHFNPFNRDKAFGGPDNDLFMWAPGDGSDFFQGGPGLDALVLGLMGEIENGQLVFRVSNDQQAGEIYFDPYTNLPVMDVTNSPGFCEVIDDSSAWDSQQELDELDLDHLVRFFIRSVADDFEAGEQDTDNGLRVTIHLANVEYLICTSRDGGHIEVWDLQQSPPVPSSLNAVPIPNIGDIVR